MTEAQIAAELQSIEKDLQQVINQLTEVAGGVERDFKGIGNDQCAKVIRSVASKCKIAKENLMKIDPGKVSLKNAAGKAISNIANRIG